MPLINSAPTHPILLIQTAFIGDVILATALVEELARTAPASTCWCGAARQRGLLILPG